MNPFSTFFNSILLLALITWISGQEIHAQEKAISSEVKHPYKLNGFWWRNISSSNESASNIQELKMAMIQATWEAVALTDPLTFAKYFDTKVWKDPRDGMLRCVAALNKFYEWDKNKPLPLFHALAVVSMRENGANPRDIQAFINKVRPQLGLPREP